MFVSGFGSVVLNESANAPLKSLQIYGKVSSISNEFIGKVVCGKNLLNPKNIKNGYIDIDGSSITDLEYANFVLYLKPGRYTMSFNRNISLVRGFTESNKSSAFTLENMSNYTNVLYVSFDVLNEENVYIAWEAYGSLDSSWDISLPVQLEEGSVMTSYEPYRVLDRTIGITVKNKNVENEYKQIDISIPVPFYRKNLIWNNNIKFETSEQVKFDYPIPAGNYTLSAVITSNDTHSEACLALFYYSDGSTKEVYMRRSFNETTRAFSNVTFDKDVTRVRFYASESHSMGSGDIATWSKIQLEEGPIMTSYEPWIEPYGLAAIQDDNGNIADENGILYTTDEIIFDSMNRYVQRIGCKYLDGVWSYYILDNSIVYPLPESLIEKFNSLYSYNPTTIVENDANAFMIIDYLDREDEDIYNGPFSDPKTEIGKYYKALAGYSDDYPNPTCRETMMLKKLLEPNYELPFSINEYSSKIELYLWGLMNNSKDMLTNIPESDTEKFLHILIGGEVTDYPSINCERNFWMSKWIEG